MQPSLHSDLADEDEHVERAGLSHAHHEREVLVAQAPAPASSSIGDPARHPQIAPHWCSSKQMASIALDEQQQQHGGRRDEMTARTTIEHSCSRIAATSDASDETNGMAGARGWGGNG